jgi:hypothetical protein
MGCCENKVIQTDIVAYSDKNQEAKQASFDDMCMDSQQEEYDKYINISPPGNLSLLNTFNSIEQAFLASMTTPKILVELPENVR